MNRAEYHSLRRLMRSWMHNKKRVARLDDFADSLLVVQIEHSAQGLRNIQARIDQLRAQLPAHGTDPLGFSTLHRMQRQRRLNVEYRCRARRRDAQSAMRREALA